MTTAITKAAKAVATATVTVPLFRNPNSPLILSSVITEDKITAGTEVVKAGASNKNASNHKDCQLKPNPKVAGLYLNNLVFLNKKGSHTPNPNLINYKFQSKIGATSAKAASLGVGVKGNVYKLLSHFFKSMYCLISKPVFIETPDRIKIQLFYFLCLPKILTDNSLLPTTSPATPGTAAVRPANAKIVDAAAAGTSFANLSIHNLKNFDNNASLFKSKKKINYLLHQLKNFNSKNLNVKLNLIKLSQTNPTPGEAVESSTTKNVAAASVKTAAVGNLALALTNVYPKKFKLICSILSKFFNKSVELELIRLHQPYYDSNILVNFLALIINKKNIGTAIQRLYNSNIINSGGAGAATSIAIETASPISASNKKIAAAYLSGLNIKISGRLMREPIIPRVTTKKFEKGFTAKGKINYSDVARFTHKNRKGAFTITVKSGQKFF